MHDDSEKYIAPDLIGNIEITDEIINKIWPIPILWNQLTKGCYSKNRTFSYKAAAYGEVMKKQVIFQTVSVKSSNELMPYQRPGMTQYYGKPAAFYNTMCERPFYYLTVQLQDSDRQVRYVNCTKKVYDALNIGSCVLVIYYGDDKIIGYKVDQQ